jgi:hypothetical protein
METFQTTVCTLVACYWTARVVVFVIDAVDAARRPPGALRRCYDDD